MKIRRLKIFQATCTTKENMLYIYKTYKSTKIMNFKQDAL